MPLMVRWMPVACAAALVFLHTSKYGPGTTHDSAAYVFAAESLAAGKGLVYFGYGTPFVQWPPLFPMLLGLFKALGIQPSAAAVTLNAQAFGLTVWRTGIWLTKHTGSPAFALLGQTAVLLSFPLLYVSGHLWSEALFILFITLFITGLSDIPENYRLSQVIPPAVFAALACLTRYMGMAAVVSGLLFLALSGKRPAARRIHSFLLFGVISSAPLAMWMVRNYLLTATLMGSRAPSTSSVVQNLGLTFKTVFSWFFPVSLLPGHARRTAACAILLATTGFIAAAAHAILVKSRRRVAPAAPYGLIVARIPPSILISAFLPAVFAVVYTGCLVVSASRVAVDTIGDRLLSPVYIPLVLLLAVFAHWACTSDTFLHTRRQKASRVLFAVLAGVIFANLTAGSVRLMSEALRTGAGGYASDRWAASATVRYLRANKPEGQVCNNFPEALYLLAGVDAVYPPKKDGPEQYGVERFKELVESGSISTVVWFDRKAQVAIYNITELEKLFHVERTVVLDDGAVYRIRKEKG